MKRIICLLTALCLVLGSFSFCFASATSWDTTDQANLSSIKSALTSGTSSVFGMLGKITGYLIYNNIPIAQTATNIYNALNSNGGSGTSHSVAWWLADIDGWLSNIHGLLSGSTSGGIGDSLNKILNALVYSDAAGNVKSWLADIWQTESVYLPDLTELRKSMTNYYIGNSSMTTTDRRLNGNNYLLNASGQYTLPMVTANAKGTTYSFQGNWLDGSPFGNLAYFFRTFQVNNTRIYENEWNYLWADAWNSQTYTDWTDLSSDTFTPNSLSGGIYTWLSNIQTPVARLSYVLASDERIAAQEAAAANEEAVVDNFIDSSGSGSASPSDIGSISDLSSGYKSNFGSDASVSGIFNIFNSNNMGWFSQETANQLDTTTSSRRGSSFDTPLLDQQIENIYDQIGVKHD